MKFFYSDTHDLKLPPGHRFPGEKYTKLRRALVDENILREDQLFMAPLADDATLHLAHDPAYVAAILSLIHI